MAEAPAKDASRLWRTRQMNSGDSWWGQRSVWTRHVTYWCLAIGLISLTAFDNSTRNIPHDTSNIGVFAWFVAVVLAVAVMALVFTIQEWERVGIARTLSRSLVLFLCMLGLAASGLFYARSWGVDIQECTSQGGQEVCGGPASPQQVLAMLAWQAANAVPALNLTDAFEWSRPARSDAAVVGATILVLRLWVVIGLLGVIKRLWDKWGPTGSAHAPSPPTRTRMMRGLADDDAAPHPIRASDVKALHGMVSVLASEAMVDGVDPALAKRLLERLVQAELVPPGSEVSLMPQALEDLAQRLLHVLREYDVPHG
jgi:hypothetical protein